jgi:hypothetical protein
MPCVGVLDMMRSIHDVPYSLRNVMHASGPGCYPFSMRHPCSSHNSINHGALLFIV